MKIGFPYPGYEQIAAVELPDANLIGVYEPHGVGQLDEEDRLDHGFDKPFGAGRLRHEVRPTDRVLVLIDDLTRGTPVPRLLKRVVGALCESGVLDRQIQVLTAQGTHRQMSDSELRPKLGEFYGRFKVHQHDWLDESQLHEFGYTTDGTRVTANRLLGENDFVIGLGSIVPLRHGGRILPLVDQQALHAARIAKEVGG